VAIRRHPDLPHTTRDAQLAIDHPVATSITFPLDVVHFLLLMNVDQPMAIHCAPQTGTLNLSRLEGRIAFDRLITLPICWPLREYAN
jgi:hypothetical protein